MTCPVTWTIAGSDSGGGAGIQADLKVLTLLGTHACSVLTAITAQNTQGTSKVDWISEAMLSAQLEQLQADLPAQAIKLGMLGTEYSVRCIAAFLHATPPPFSVCDPILLSSSGTPLLEPSAWPVLVHELLPVVDLLTPNIPEIEHLLSVKISTRSDLESAAKRFLDLGVSEVLIKGGHASNDAECSVDYWTNGADSYWLSSPRIETTSSHGTGCVLSSAIAAARAKGATPLDSIVIAKAYLNQALRTAPHLGSGTGPLGFLPWEASPEDLPYLSTTRDQRGDRVEAPKL
jgi:hydroxymethylpyrimidine kinase/phosphomethylpyrimidine kinase/thiamine-phosphate diphosphorylase